MTDLHKRVNKLEISDKKNSNDITKLKTDVGHIKSDMSDLKTMAIDNAKANIDSDLKHKDTNTTIKEFFGFMKGAIWIMGILVTGVTIAMQLVKFNA